MTASRTLFLRQLIRNPRQVSAIAPSSPFLARAMARQIPDPHARVVEFGPGTGALTRGILACGVPPANLTLLELDPVFARALAAQFPGVRVLNAGADRAADHCEPGVGAVISGLPLLSMPDPIAFAIVRAAFAVLAAGAPLIQFTYGRRPSIAQTIIEGLDLRAEERQFVPLNLPPARVHCYYRRSDTPLPRHG